MIVLMPTAFISTNVVMIAYAIYKMIVKKI